MISAKIIKDSINTFNSIRIITWELEYPRFIHSELMTHRVFSRNSASSRAIPVEKMLETIMSNPAGPVHWGKNQSGMQAKEELQGEQRHAAMQEWNSAMLDAINHSSKLHELGVHKQITNRVTEPYQHMKVVVTTTQHENWDWLRRHPDAQPEIHELAKRMHAAKLESEPVKLYPGQWHLPYVEVTTTEHSQRYYDENGNEIDLEKAKKISASCCAQVSYRRSDASLEKAENIFARLIESEPMHASPVEHQAMAFDSNPTDAYHWSLPDGVTHVDRKLRMWSGNFCGWIQYRQLIPGNAKDE